MKFCTHLLVHSVFYSLRVSRQRVNRCSSCLIISIHWLLWGEGNIKLLHDANFYTVCHTEHAFLNQYLSFLYLWSDSSFFTLNHIQLCTVKVHIEIITHIAGNPPLSSHTLLDICVTLLYYTLTICSLIYYQHSSLLP